MEFNTINRLIEVNRQFYQTFAVQFSSTRERIQPGVRRLLPLVKEADRVLDLGCGNGELAVQLYENGFRGEYTGVEQSEGLIESARRRLPGELKGTVIQGDLTLPDWDSGLQKAGYDWIFLFAVLHHIPGEALRIALMQNAHNLLASGGRLALSAWQFLEGPRFAARIQPWERIGLSPEDVDPGDTLLDWRSGGEGLRYVHQFSEDEFRRLADRAGFRVVETHWSDGREGRSGLYQIWS